MLEKDPEKRMSAVSVLSHTFFTTDFIIDYEFDSIDDFFTDLSSAFKKN